MNNESAKIFYCLGHKQFQPEILVKHAQLAEKVSFDGLFISEHFNPWVDDAGPVVCVCSAQ